MNSTQRRATRACAVAAGLAAPLWAVTACTATDPTPAATVTVTAAPPPPSREPAGTVQQEVDAAGVTAWNQTRVIDVARRTGYLPAGAQEQDALNFVYMAVLECRDVTSGRQSWVQSYERAVSTGARETDALQMTQHLQHVFCPTIR